MERAVSPITFIADDASRCPVCGKATAGTITYWWKGRDVRKEVPCRCDCLVREDRARERADLYARNAKIEAQRLYKAFGSRFPQGSFSNDDGRNGRAMEACRAYFERFGEIRSNKVNGLALHGSARQGKTFAAEAVAMGLHSSGLSVLMDTAAGFVQRMSGDRAAADALRARAARCDLLVIDDLGASRDTSYGREAVFSLVDSRVASGRPLLVTTNIDLGDQQGIASCDDQRSMIRVLERCLPVKVECGRSPYDGDAYSIAAEILGF